MKPYFLREAESKMFLSPWRISLVEAQDACFVGTVVGDSAAVSFIACFFEMYCEGLHQEY